ncbi:hypothetical protein C5167_005324 [Papaver somniferum]|uniref:Uncharacterized protein n=1 Tax=Papaver somniferum TaxID=3469 RepID=A0A4Y7JA84_PAPSO|nr:hypothetical protein C5167_005324 [Papaver somniferum]
MNLNYYINDNGYTIKVL